MRRLPYGFVALSVALLVILPRCVSTGDAPEILLLRQDERFVRAELVRGGIGICGVVSQQHATDDATAMQWAEILETTCREERHDLTLRPLGWVRANMAPDRRTSLLKEYLRTGTVAPDSLREVKPFQNACRYLLLARILYNSVKKDSIERTEEKVGEWKGFDSLDEEEQIESTQEEVWIDLISTRSMGVALDVVDLDRASLVWGYAVFDQLSYRRSYGKNEPKSVLQQIISIPARAVFEVAVHPKEPTTEELLRKLFGILVQRFP